MNDQPKTHLEIAMNSDPHGHSSCDCDLDIKKLQALNMSLKSQLSTAVEALEKIEAEIGELGYGYNESYIGNVYRLAKEALSKLRKEG